MLERRPPPAAAPLRPLTCPGCWSAPVGEQLATQAEATVDLELADYEFRLSDVNVDAGVITFARTTLSKITFEITSSNGAPRVAEYETYAA